MEYRAELELLRKTLNKARVQSRLLCIGERPEQQDYGLRQLLGLEEDHDLVLRYLRERKQENTVYKLTDEIFCSYVFFMLPETEEKQLLLIGPFLAYRPEREAILEMAERFGVSAANVRHVEEYFAAIPLIADDSLLFLMITAFADRLWSEGGSYECVDINRDSEHPIHVTRHGGAGSEPPEDVLLQMKLMETRYAYENELLENVSKGNVHRAERMILRASQESMKPRVADPIRNMKNYCIICNTLMRKAAERGGVHPFHLDRLSSQFATRIESVSGYDAGRALMGEMTREYCRLVRKKSMKHYSALIRNVVSYIETDLSGDLRLSTLASVHNINASYLSALFKKETGETVTEFINKKRIELGKQLLVTSRLQIQTVAQHCGMPDANYFSKLFKKQVGMTPKQYRENNGR